MGSSQYVLSLLRISTLQIPIFIKDLHSPIMCILSQKVKYQSKGGRKYHIKDLRIHMLNKQLMIINKLDNL